MLIFLSSLKLIVTPQKSAFQNMEAGVPWSLSEKDVCGILPQGIEYDWTRFALQFLLTDHIQNRNPSWQQKTHSLSCMTESS